MLIKLVLLTIITSALCQEDSNCTITDFQQVSDVVSSCTVINISNLVVPAGQTLNLDLQKGSTVTFHGRIVFEVAYWLGFLVKVTGENVLVQGEKDSILNGQGELYWDGQGENGGVTKPRFFHIATTGESVFRNIHLLNCPYFCVRIGASNLTLTGWFIDNFAGNTQGGHNTDGFGIDDSSNILIENSVVLNQDDCVVVNSGSNMVFRNLECYGSHGLSFSFGSKGRDDVDCGTISNITFTDCQLANGLYGIHVKTTKGTGLITDVNYNNITFSGIMNDGIYINQDYDDIGNLTRQIEIKNLNLNNVRGFVLGENSTRVRITCSVNKCHNWNWTDIDVEGPGENSCNFTPSGFNC